MCVSTPLQGPVPFLEHDIRLHSVDRLRPDPPRVCPTLATQLCVRVCACVCAGMSRCVGCVFPLTTGGCVLCDRNLSLDDNALNGTIPSTISGMTALEHLELQDNHLTGAIPNSISVLTRLTLIRMSSNMLSSTLPSQIGLLSQLMYVCRNPWLQVVIVVAHQPTAVVFC